MTAAGAYEQLALPDLVASPAGTSLLPIQQRFARFHADNPHVYEELRRMALDLIGQGHRRLSIDMLYQVLRWSALRTRSDDSGYKLNDHYRSRYARLLADSVPELADAFELRRLTA